MDDMRKYVPDVGKVLRETTPAKVAERRRLALEGLDRASDPRVSEPALRAEARVHDEGAPPSGAAPKAEEASAFEVPKAAPARPVAPRSAPWMVVGAVVAVTLPAVVAVVMSSRSTEKKITEAIASAKASAAAPARVEMSAPATAPEAPPPPSTASVSATATRTTTTRAAIPRSSPSNEPPMEPPAEHDAGTAKPLPPEDF